MKKSSTIRESWGVPFRVERKVEKRSGRQKGRVDLGKVSFVYEIKEGNFFLGNDYSVWEVDDIVLRQGVIPF